MLPDERRCRVVAEIRASLEDHHAVGLGGGKQRVHLLVGEGFHGPPLIRAARASVASAIFTCAASTRTPLTPTAPSPFDSPSRYAATLRSARAISSSVGA